MESVNLRIKSPSADYADINLSVSVHENVLDIKRRIEAEYPSSPAPDHQKLVYSGKLLQDTMVLGDFLRFEDDCSVYTIHLVCKLLSSKPEPAETSSPSTSSNDGLRNRHEPAINNFVQQHQQSDVPDQNTTVADNSELEAIRGMLTNLIQSTMATGNISPEEMVALNQLQAQYTALYNEHLLQQTTTLEQGAVQIAPEQPQQQAPQQQQQQLQPEAAAGEEEDQGNNDLLEYAYSVIRVLILLCVMYVHSSFFRLLFVAGGMLLAYLFQGRNRREVNNNNNNNNNQNNAPVHDNPVGPDEVAAVQEGQASDDETAVVEAPKPNVLVVAFTFVTSLITSILPEQNQVI